ncbi:MAG: polyketide synthase, partial [Planctomycetota bacterium]
MTRFDPIAIVGLGGLFPGSGPGASDLDAFWKLVRDGNSAAREVPEGRWVLPPDQATSEERGESDRVNSVRGCFLDAVPSAPEAVAKRLRESGIDLAGLDPLLPLTLFAGDQAYRNGRLDRFEPSRVGAVFGNIVLPTDGSSALGRDTFDAALRDRFPDLATVLDQPLPSHDTVDPRNRYVAGHPATILARGLGIEGGVSTLDAACASSLFALRLAARDLHDGRLDAVIAGGVSRPDCQYTQMGFSQLRAVSRRGVCSPFDADGDGLVVGEGGALFALRRLADAEADGDEILGVLRGIGLSNDVGGSLLAPDSEGQLRAMREAYAQARWSPKDVDLIECHATGTPLGDAVELRSLRALWAEAPKSDGYPAPAAPCVVGSVKSNVGHLLTGAGAAGLTKVLLSFRHETLPPTAAFSTPNAELLPDGTPFRVLAESAPFPRRAKSAPRRAAVSAFGFGGINAHVLVEEWTGASAGSKKRRQKKKNKKKQRSAPMSKKPTSNAEPIAIVGIGGRLPGCTDGNLRSLAATLLGTEVDLPGAVDRGCTTDGRRFGLTSQ